MSLPELMVKPMREELKRIGFAELRTPAEVERALDDRAGTVLVAVNSVCGCAAGMMRPAVAMALKHEQKPGRLITVFAGQDPDATARAREYFTGYEPSSPALALFKEGQLVYMLERKDILRRAPELIAHDLRQAFDRFCG